MELEDPYEPAGDAQSQFEKQVKEEKKIREKHKKEEESKRKVLEEHPGWKYFYDGPDEVPDDGEQENVDLEVPRAEPDPEEEEQEAIHLVPFNANIIKPDWTLVVLGKRRTGKSYFARWIMHRMRQFYPRGWVFTRTRHNGFWQNHVPDRFIHDGFQQHVVQEIIQQQKDLADIRHKNKESTLNDWAFIIFDDVIDQNLRFETLFEQLFYNGRHLHLFIIVTAQYVKSLHPGVRANADLMVTFIQAQEMQRECIAKEWIDGLPKKTSFRILDMLTPKSDEPNREERRNAFIAIDTSYVDFKPADENIYIGKASDPGPFALGGPEYWKKDMDKWTEIRREEIKFTGAKNARTATSPQRGPLQRSAKGFL